MRITSPACAEGPTPVPGRCGEGGYRAAHRVVAMAILFVGYSRYCEESDKGAKSRPCDE
jgi:hypothetical protein